MKLQLLKNQLFHKGPSHLVLHVTSRCNRSCQTCFVRTRDAAPTEEISLSEIKKLAEGLNNLIFLDIGGGEPFLRNDLPEICAAFKTRYLSIPTNGFDPERIHYTITKIQKKAAAILSISVSLDGFEKTNDTIRGHGSFQNALQTVLSLRKIPGIYLKINTVLSDRNYYEIIPFMEYARTLAPDFHSIIFLRGRPRNESVKCPSVKELADIKEKVLAIWKTYGYGQRGLDKFLLRNYHRNMYASSLRVMQESRQTPPCLAHKHHLVVYPNGDAAFCEMLAPFGNILQRPLPRLLQEEKAVGQVRRIKSGGCFCYHNCNMMDNYFLNLFQYPKLLLGL